MNNQQRASQPRVAEEPAPNKLYTLQVFLFGEPVGEEFADREISRTMQIRGGYNQMSCTGG
jgi:hypothetical protein